MIDVDIENSQSEKTSLLYYQSCFPSRHYVPRRFLLALITFFGIFLILILRGCISVAVTGDSGMGAEFGWTNTAKGTVLSSFYWGYICPQVLGGWLSVRYGARWIFGPTVFIAVTFSTLTPIAATNFSALIFIRILVGLFEGAVMPNVDQLVARWMPPRERSRTMSFFAGGSYFGSGTSVLITPLIMSSFGWRGVFYVYGIMGFVWFIGWFLLGYSAPSSHPFISGEEKDYIQKSLRECSTELGDDRELELDVPWKALITAPPILAACVAHFCFNWSYYTLLSFLPDYFYTILGYSITQGGFIQVAPYMSMFIVSQLSGQLVELLTGIKGGKPYLTLTNARKLVCGLGFLTPAVLLTGIGFVNSSEGAVVMMTIAIAFSGFSAAGHNASFNDIAPFHAGIIQGFSNTGATLPGIISPILCGYLLDGGGCIRNKSGSEVLQPDTCVMAWRIIFYIAAFIFVFGFIVYTTFIKGTAVVDEKGRRVDLMQQKDGYELL